jgi:sulfide:quinone oxidoreductase
MADTLILGGGFGGISTAYELRSLLGPEHRITLIARDPSFVMGLRKLWALVGAETLDAGTRWLQRLERLGLDHVPAEITSIDAAARLARTSEGDFRADHLVIALGAETRPDLVPGLAEYGHNVWKASEVAAAARALSELTSGKLLILIAGAPYPCPPAPYECAMLVDEYLREQGRRSAVEIGVSTIQPLLMPNAGRVGSDWVAGQLSQRGISFQTGKRITRVEADRVVYEDGEDPFDMLIGVPPHQPPAVVAGSGLVSESGWMSVDAGTLETQFEGVYAVGDVTLIRLANGLPLPKAGAIAELEGTRVARAIAAKVLGHANVPAFDGAGTCFIEMGKHEGALVEGRFYAQPEPDVRITGPSEANAALKRAFESERLARWFGS